MSGVTFPKSMVLYSFHTSKKHHGGKESHEDVTIKITAPADAGTVLKTRMAKNDMDHEWCCCRSSQVKSVDYGSCASAE